MPWAYRPDITMSETDTDADTDEHSEGPTFYEVTVERKAEDTFIVKADSRQQASLALEAPETDPEVRELVENGDYDSPQFRTVGVPRVADEIEDMDIEADYDDTGE